VRHDEKEILEGLRRIEQRLDELALILQEILEELPSPVYMAPAGFSFTASSADTPRSL
jgi:hypothetical protein